MKNLKINFNSKFLELYFLEHDITSLLRQSKLAAPQIL